MFEKELIGAMMDEGINTDIIRKVMQCIDSVAINYSIKRAESNIVVYDHNNVNSQYVNLFLQCRSFEGLASGTVENMGITLRRFINFISCSVLEVTSMTVRVFLSACKSRNKKELSAATMENYRQHLASFFRWLVDEKQIERNPIDNIPNLKLGKDFKGALTPEDVSKIKYACKNTREKILIEFLVSSGLRINEFVNIKVKDINLIERSVKVLGKGKKERMAYFSYEAKILIEEYIKTSKSPYLFGHARRGIDGKYGKITTGAARQQLESVASRVADKLSLKKVTPHTFRRTFATALLRKGVALEIVSKLLGHANLQTTMRYVEITEDDIHRQHTRYVN